MRLVFALSAALLPAFAAAQMDHGAAMGATKPAAVPSKSLVVSGFYGQTKTLSPSDLAAMPHVQVTVINGHSHKQETYSGVTVKDLLALVPPAMATVEGPVPKKISPRTTVILAEGTDKFLVALTLCDTDPGCRSGQAIVADSVDGKPLTTDGAFKLILTEDKMPGRWVRNLDALTEKNVGVM